MGIGDIDFALSLGGLFAGLMVGLTGMGGAALVTPMLVLLFGVSPAAAVSSDVVAAAIMKPAGTRDASPRTMTPMSTATSGSTTVSPAITRSGEPTEYAV